MASSSLIPGKENKPLHGLLNSSTPTKNTFTVAAISSATMPARTLTPTKDYFSSPITTLSRSVTSPRKISRLDTVEAYRAFTNKLREEIDDVLEEKRRHKVYRLLHDNCASLFSALNRDLKIFTTTSSWDASLSKEDASTVLMEHLSLPIAAARFLAQIARFPPLSTQFRSTHLQALVKTVAEILLADEVPEAGLARTWEALTFFIGSQRFSYEILSPSSSHIVNALHKGFNGTIESISARVQALRAISGLITEHPLKFTPAFFRIFHEIFPLLMHPSLELRQQAGRTIASLALIRLAHPSASSAQFHSLAIKMCTFINDNSTRSAGLSQAGKIGFALDPEQWLDSERPYWTTPVIASLIILSDYRAFIHQRNLRVFQIYLEGVQKHHSTERLLYTMMHCLVWAYSRVLHRKETSTSQDPDNLVKTDRSFLVASQKLHDGIGEAVLSIILRHGSANSQPTPQATLEALSVVKRMVTDEDASVQTDGVCILANLVASIGASTPPVANNFPSPEEYVNRGLFADAFFDAEKGSIKSIIRDMQLGQRPDFSWRFSGEDVEAHWDTLLDLWQEGVNAHITYRTSSSSLHLLQIWKQLLWTHAESIRKGLPANSIAAATRQIALALTNSFTVSDFGKEAVQGFVLSFVQRLWLALKDVFQAPYLQDYAHGLLQAVCDSHCLVDVEAVGSLWTELSLAVLPDSDATSYNLIGPFVNIFSKSPSVTQTFWSVLAEACRDGCEATVEDLLTFLQVSYGRWTFTARQLDLWGEYAAQAGTLASFDSAEIKALICSEYSLTHSGPSQCLTFFTQVSSICIEDLPLEVLSSIDEALVALYPTAPSQEIPSCVLPFLLSVGKRMRVEPTFMFLIETLGRGLELWLTDVHELWPLGELVAIVNGLFCEPLEGIKAAHAPSLQFIQDFTPYCHAVITHSRTKDPLAAHSLYEFWNEHYKSCGHDPRIPEDLLLCLRVLEDINCPVDIPETQSTTVGTIVPDSYVEGTPQNHARARLFSSTPQSPGTQRLTPTTGRRSSNARHVDISDTPTRQPAHSRKRPSPSQAEGSKDAKKLKLSPSPKGASASPSRKRRLIFDGVVIPRNTLTSVRRSQLMTPCPSEASLHTDGRPGSQNLSQPLPDPDEVDAEEEEDEHDFHLEESQRMVEDEDEDLDVVPESQQMDEEMDLSFDHDAQERGASYVCPSPPHLPNRSHTEPLAYLSIDASPPSLKRAQTIPATAAPVALHALRQAATDISAHPLSKEELIEAHRLIHGMNHQIVQQMEKMLADKV